MTSEPDPRPVAGWGVASATLAPVLLIGGWTLAARLQRGGFDPVSDTISALAARDADHRWVMTTALVGVGVSHLVTALALRPAAWPGRVMLGLGGVATLLVAAAPLPGGDGVSTPHVLAATTAFVSLAVWPAVSWRARSTDPARRAGAAPPWRPEVALPATGVLLAGLGWFFAELAGGGGQVGLTERVAAGSQALWPLAAVLLARRWTPSVPWTHEGSTQSR